MNILPTEIKDDTLFVATFTCQTIETCCIKHQTSLFKWFLTLSLNRLNAFDSNNLTFITIRHNLKYLIKQ
nr:MAG TPA: hypothetical protein [Caudoviricetes sp.]